MTEELWPTSNSISIVPNSPGANPFAANDPLAIARARGYLSQFAGIERFYLPSWRRHRTKILMSFSVSSFLIEGSHRQLLHGARRLYARRFRVHARCDPQSVSLFTGKSGSWERSRASELDPAALQQKITERYYQEFGNEWRKVLQTSKGGALQGSSRCGRSWRNSPVQVRLCWSCSGSFPTIPTWGSLTLPTTSSLCKPWKLRVPLANSRISTRWRRTGRTSKLWPSCARTSTLCCRVRVIRISLSRPRTQPVQRRLLPRKSWDAQVDQNFIRKTRFADSSRNQYQRWMLSARGTKEALNGAGQAFCTQFAAEQ